MPQDWQKHLILSTQMAGQLCVVTLSHLEKNMILQSHFTKKGKKKLLQNINWEGNCFTT